MTRKLAWIVVWFIIIFSYLGGVGANFPDTQVYLQAGTGYYLDHPIAAPQPGGVKVFMGWIYAWPLHWLWVWMQYFSWPFAATAWFSLNALALILLTKYLLREIKHYAWIVLVVFAKVLAPQLGGTNIHIALLALSAASPWGVTVACAFKPYFAVLLLLHFWHERTSMAADKPVSCGPRR